MNVSCPMNCYLLQQGVPFVSGKDDYFRQSDCTASDLMPRKARQMLFQYICVPQTCMPAEHRDHCMNCGDMFGSASNSGSGSGSGNGNGNSTPGSSGRERSRTNSSVSTSTTSYSDTSTSTSIANTATSFFSSAVLSAYLPKIRFSSGKHHCRVCNRVVCQECSSNYLEKKCMPLFIQENPSSSERSYRVCKVCFVMLAAQRRDSVSS